MQARLKVVQDNANLKQVKLLPITVIGRGAECHLKIASTQVSRKHCRITVTDNEVLVEDLTSSNGTYVNQEKIASGKLIVVAPGTKLQIGPATFIVDYTPPVNLETMPTTVIKAADLQALNQIALPKKAGETSVPTIDPFTAAVANGMDAGGRITPNLMPAPLPPESMEPPAGASSAPVEPAAEIDVSVSKQVDFFESSPSIESVPVDAPPLEPEQPPVIESVAAPVAVEPPASPVIAPFVPPIIEVSQPAPISAVVVSAPPLMAAPVVTAPVAAPVAVAAAVPVASPPAPAVAAPTSGFDFLSGAAPAAAAVPGAFDAFQFDAATPAPAGAPVPPPAAKPPAAKKPLFGLFGKKEKAPPAPAAPAVAAPAAVVPAAPANTDNAPFSFQPASAPPMPAAAPPAADPAPPASDDPFAFLR